MSDGDQRDAALARLTFARLAAHALRGATHSFVNALSMLANEDAVGPLNATQRRLLNNGRTAATQLSQLCDDIALLAKADEGPLSLNREPLVITTLLRRAVEQAQQPDAPPTPRKIEPRITPALPELSGDPILMRRAIAAVVENALRFSPADRPVTVEARKKRQRLIVSVSDEGPGVPSEQVDAIFEMLEPQRAPLQAIGVGMGLGVGLAVARAIVEAHGGAITVERSVAGGALFTFSLPIDGSA